MWNSSVNKLRILVGGEGGGEPVPKAGARCSHAPYRPSDSNQEHRSACLRRLLVLADAV